MIRLNFEGKVKEITYKNKTCVKMLIVDNYGAEILGTITKQDMDLADVIKEDKSYIFVGVIEAYKTIGEKTTFIDNSYYIKQIIEVN